MKYGVEVERPLVLMFSKEPLCKSWTGPRASTQKPGEEKAERRGESRKKLKFF